MTRRRSVRGRDGGLGNPRSVWALAVCGALAGCSSEAPPAGPGRPAAEGSGADLAGGEAPAELAAPWFEECAAERGLRFVHDSGADGRYLFPEIMGGGAALLDLDGDGDLDAYLVQSGASPELRERPADGPSNRLYRNEGGGRFVDATAGSGADDRGYGMGVAAGDADGDGDSDLYVTNLHGNAFLENLGQGRFRDRTEERGLEESSWSVSAAFFDAENDGDLDLFVVNYVRWSPAEERACRGGRASGADYCSPRSFDAPAVDAFLRNEGAGAFVDASAASGIRAAFGNGLGLVCADFDGDGFEDVFVANDGTVNQFWHSLGNGAFEDRALRVGCGVDDDGLAKAGMGVAAADLDDDGDEDLLVVNLSKEADSYYRNEVDSGKLYFQDRTALAGLAVASKPFTRFGAGLVDLDNDGWLDLFEANGRVASAGPRAPSPDDPYAETNLLFRGVPGGRFEEVAPRGGTRRELVETSRGAAFGDVDGDGGVDVLVVNRDAPAHLYRNLNAGTTGTAANWLRLRLRLPAERDAPGRDALGATVRGRLGERTLTRRLRGAYSYASACDPSIHLGLGSAPELSDVVVRWPDGSEESFGDLPGGSEAILVQGRGTGAPR